ASDFAESLRPGVCIPPEYPLQLVQPNDPAGFGDRVGTKPRRPCPRTNAADPNREKGKPGRKTGAQSHGPSVGTPSPLTDGRQAAERMGRRRARPSPDRREPVPRRPLRSVVRGAGPPRPAAAGLVRSTDKPRVTPGLVAFMP